MVNHVSFGRRADRRHLPAHSMGANKTAAQATRVASTGPSIGGPVPLSEKTDFPSLDDDLRQWKAARKQNFEFPWRSISLMATLCFGIASFVLPDSVNDDVQWLLYALAGASMYVGFRKRHRRAKS
jgi:hypothetical protein